MSEWITFFKKLAGGSDLEDALRSLETLTRQEARMAIAQVLKATHGDDDTVGAIFEGTGTVSILSLTFLEYFHG
jgi:hypothetical protein